MQLVWLISYIFWFLKKYLFYVVPAGSHRFSEIQFNIIQSRIVNARCEVKNREGGTDGYALRKGEQKMYTILGCTCTTFDL
jgi:hypothetical protein